MSIVLSHKIRLNPTLLQADYFSQACGTARFSYNWGLARWKQQYEDHKNDPSLPMPSEGKLRKELNVIKAEKYPWMLSVPKNAPQKALMNLGTAFKNLFKGNGKYPQFKKKGVHDSFYLDNTQFQLSKDGKKLIIPCAKQSTTIDRHHRDVKMAESFRFPHGKILSATISRTAGMWFVSISVELPDSFRKMPGENQAGIGVDVGLKDMAVLSDGTRFKPHKALAKNLTKLRRANKALSRKQKGSVNRTKDREKVARLHYRISCIRQDSIHKMTSFLAKTYGLIGVEDLNVSGMQKNRHLARHISDIAWGEIRRQLVYKADLYGSRVVEADRFFPSSQLSSCCGIKNPAVKNLNVRKWNCPKCGNKLDRDINAAQNLLQYAEKVVRDMAESSPVMGSA